MAAKKKAAKKKAAKKAKLHVVSDPKKGEPQEYKRAVKLPEDVSWETLSKSDRKRYREALDAERETLDGLLKGATRDEARAIYDLMLESSGDSIRLRSGGNIWRALSMVEAYAYWLTDDHRKKTAELAKLTLKVGERNVASVRALKRMAIGIVQGLDGDDCGECENCSEDCDGDCDVGPGKELIKPTQSLGSED